MRAMDEIHCHFLNSLQHHHLGYRKENATGVSDYTPNEALPREIRDFSNCHFSGGELLVWGSVFAGHSICVCDFCRFFMLFDNFSDPFYATSSSCFQGFFSVITFSNHPWVQSNNCSRWWMILSNFFKSPSFRPFFDPLRLDFGGVICMEIHHYSGTHEERRSWSFWNVQDEGGPKTSCK